MNYASKSCLIAGILLLFLTIFNAFTSEVISPSLLRAEVISSMACIGIILVSIIWSDINPISPSKADLKGSNGFFLISNLSDQLSRELAWGSQLLLTATPASTLLIYWKDKTILKRGLLSEQKFIPGPICNQATVKSNLISLVKTSLFPGRKEFDTIVENLPSIIIFPLGISGYLIIGGWSERCFSKADEKWISGWSDKLYDLLNT